MCHGGYDEKRKAFFLAIEDNNSKMRKLFPEELKQYISKKHGDQEIELAFINACHSEPFGRIFLEAGIKRVICVQADLKIADKVA